MAVKIDKDECCGCGTCVEACPAGALTIEDEVAVVDESACLDCGICTEECPLGALKLSE